MRNRSLGPGIVLAVATTTLILAATPSPEVELPAPIDVDEDLAILTAPIAEASTRESTLGALQKRILEEGPSSYLLERLGWTFILEARRTQDPGFYNLAALGGRVLARVASGSPEADLLLGHALHGLHRFEEAEDAAQRVVERRGGPADFGLLGDVQLDRGRLEDAVVAYGRMVALKPGSHAYCRIAQVRFLRGDLEGAIEAMILASSAVSPRNAETYGWTWSRLAEYQLRDGRFEEALRSCRHALEVQPDGPRPLAILGRVHLAMGNPAEALDPLRRAATSVPSPEVLWALEDALRALGLPGQADAVSAQLLARGESVDPRGFALYLASRGLELERASSLIERELEQRQDVYTWDVLARVQAARGAWDEAWISIRRALAEGTRDGRLFLHAAAIARKVGAQEEDRLARAATLRMHELLPSEQGELLRLFPAVLDVAG